MKKKDLEKATLVCVTDQYKCENLIAVGRGIADVTSTNLYVINVDNYARSNGNNILQDSEALEYLFAKSKENDAEMNVVYDRDFLEVMKEFIDKYNAVNVITGVPQQENSVLQKLWRHVSWVDYYMVNEQGVSVKVASGAKSSTSKK